MSGLIMDYALYIFSYIHKNGILKDQRIAQSFDFYPKTQ